MTVPHEQWLVVLSIAIAIQGSFVGLSLARGLDAAEGLRRRALLAGASAYARLGAAMHSSAARLVPILLDISKLPPVS